LDPSAAGGGRHRIHHLANYYSNGNGMGQCWHKITHRMKPSSNRSPRTPNQLPEHLENEILYYFKFIRDPHDVPFGDFVDGATPDLFGPPKSDLRYCATQFYNKIYRSYDYHLQRNQALRTITPEQAPHAHKYLQQFLNSSNHRAPPNTMSDDKSYRSEEFDSADEEQYDRDYRPSPPHHPFGDNNRRTSSESVGGKLVVQKDFDARTLANHDFGKGIPDDMDTSMLRYLLKKLNRVVALDHTDPSTLPIGVDFILVKDAPTRKADVSYDKLILVLQVTDMESLSYISARLSKDGKVIIVEAPIKER
jgi:hypothetical protein